MLIAEALRKKKKLSEKINRLLSERSNSAQIYEDEQDSFRSFEEIEQELNDVRNEYHELNSKILVANATHEVNEDMLIVDAIQQISFLRREINSLQSLIAEVQGGNDNMRIYRSPKSKDDVPLVPQFDQTEVREKLEEMEKELADLDVELQQINWQVEI